MAWIRQSPSGKWAATVRYGPGPNDRITESFRLKGQAEKWAGDQESDIRRGDWIDPRAGDITVGQWWERTKKSRRLELASRKRDESHWRNHVEPKWGKVRIGAILKPDVTAWVVQMEEARVGAATIEGAVGVLRALGELAVEAKLIRTNPAYKIRKPDRNAHVDRILTPHEDDLLLNSLDQQFPGRADARLFVEMLEYCGLRWEEAAALCRTHLDMRRQAVRVGPVVERDGTIRPYPKSPAGERTVPVDDDIWPRLRAHAMTVRPGCCTDDKPGGLLFTAPEGGVLHYSSWHDRVWQRALVQRRGPDFSGLGEWLDGGIARLGLDTDKQLAKQVGLNPSLLSSWRAGRFRPRPASLDRLARVLGDPPAAFVATEVVLLDDPQPTPHDLRHTYGTRLAEEGVPPHEIMALMGHENLESVQRYLHAGEDRFARAREAMRQARTVKIVSRP